MASARCHKHPTGLTAFGVTLEPPVERSVRVTGDQSLEHVVDFRARQHEPLLTPNSRLRSRAA